MEMKIERAIIAAKKPITAPFAFDIRTKIRSNAINVKGNDEDNRNRGKFRPLSLEYTILPLSIMIPYHYAKLISMPFPLDA